MSDALRFGVIGTGMMGCEHIRNLDALPDAQLVAVADPSERSLGWAVKAAEGAVATYDDHVEMLEHARLDAVVVASPNHTHRSVLDAVWDTDVHVMIEKPLCTTVEDCLAVRDRAGEHRGLVWMGLEYRYMPPAARLITEIRSGVAGELKMVTIREHRYPFLEKVDDWNRFARNTGNTLVEKCCHFFDMMNLILGERPTRVLASGAQDVNHLDERYGGEVPDILDNAFVTVDYPSGARALLDLCMFAEGSRWEQEITVVGDAGKVEALLPNFMELSRGRKSELVIGSRGPDWPVEVETDIGDERVAYEGGHHGASFLELSAMCEAIRTGEPAAVTLDDGLWSVAMGVAAHRSIDEGRIVQMSELL